MKRFPIRRRKYQVTVQLWPEHAAVLNALMRERNWTGSASDFLGEFLCGELREGVALNRAVYTGRPGPDHDPQLLPVANTVRRYLNRR